MRWVLLRRRWGYTLIEVLVVLLLLGLTMSLVIPALGTPFRHEPALTDLAQTARDLAIVRADIVLLHIEPTGEWRLEPAAKPGATTPEAILQRGRIAPIAKMSLTLRIAPEGSCAFAVPATSLPSTSRPVIDLPDCGVTNR